MRYYDRPYGDIPWEDLVASYRRALEYTQQPRRRGDELIEAHDWHTLNGLQAEIHERAADEYRAAMPGREMHYERYQVEITPDVDYAPGQVEVRVSTNMAGIKWSRTQAVPPADVTALALKVLADFRAARGTHQAASMVHATMAEFEPGEVETR